jgi:hypothetical protein
VEPFALVAIPSWGQGAKALAYAPTWELPRHRTGIYLRRSQPSYRSHLCTSRSTPQLGVERARASVEFPRESSQQMNENTGSEWRGNRENEDTLTFEERLKTSQVKKAFDTLVKDNVNPILLEHWLRTIAASRDKYVRRNEPRREVRRLAYRAKKLASEIERATQSPPILLMATSSEIQLMLELPKVLREYAIVWTALLSLPRSRGASPRTEEIAALLEIVKSLAGRYHYREVADLLDVMTSTRWDELKLKQLHYRAKKRLNRVLQA